MKKLIIYENGDKVVWNGRAEIHYHQTKILQEHDLTHATWDEIEHLKKNPNDQKLLLAIKSRKAIR